MYPPNLNVPLPDPSPLAPEQTLQPSGVEQALPMIASLFSLGTALGGSPNAGAALLHGTQQSLQQRDQERQVKAKQQQDWQLRQQQMAQVEAYRQAQEQAKIDAAKQKLIMDTAVQARAAKTRQEYEQIIQQNEAIGVWLGMRPNTIRSTVPYHAPNANEVMAAAAEKFLKNPANAQAIEQGKLDGVIALDVQGDGIPIHVPVRDVLTAGGVQFDPQTGVPMVMPKAAKAPGGVQLDDEAFLGDVAKFEAEKGRPATQAERGQIALSIKERMAAASRAPVGEGGLKDYQKFTAGEKLADKWTRTNTAVREMNRQFNLMRTGLQRFKQGDKMGGSQAVLVTFQKILDPTSVVRESEYARSAAGLSLISRLEGYAERLKSGGAGVPVQDLAAMVETARQFLSSMQSYTNGQRRRIGATAKQYGIDPSLVFDDLTPDDAGDTQPDTAGGVTVTVGGKSYTFPNQAAADAFKAAAAGKGVR